jgi:hypothetical protein
MPPIKPAAGSNSASSLAFEVLMRSLIVVLGCLVIVVSGCSGEASVQSTTTSATAATTAADSEPTVTTTTAPTTTTAAAMPGIAAMTSGRGDDGSLEVGVWLAEYPTTGDVSISVGTDSDDSYPGVGDPVPHIDGWLDIRPTGLSLFDGGVAVSDDTASDFSGWVSWTGPGRIFWVYFLQTVPVRAGTMWIVVEVDGVTSTGMAAAAPVGEGCSYHGSGIDLGSVPGDVPQMAGPCRYPGL